MRAEKWKNDSRCGAFRIVIKYWTRIALCTVGEQA